MGPQLYDSEKRLHPRMSADIKCIITFNNKTYKGIINNVSRHGLYIRITSELTDHLIKLSIRDNIRISYTIPSGEELRHDCNVRWLHTYDRQLNIGVEVFEPPSPFMSFVLKKESNQNSFH
jgi:hypothetical protein